jgi:hypothetical protein
MREGAMNMLENQRSCRDYDKAEKVHTKPYYPLRTYLSQKHNSRRKDLRPNAETGEPNLSWIRTASGRMTDNYRAVHVGTKSQGHTQRRVEAEKGFGRSLASSAGSNDHNPRMETIMHNAPDAQQTAMLSQGKARMMAPTKKRNRAT